MAPVPMHFRVTPARRFGATALAGLLSLYACLAVVHGAEHEHRYCAEHEAFEEVVSSEASQATGATEPDAGEEAHQACVLAECVERHGSAVLVVAAAVAPLLRPSLAEPEPRAANPPVSPLAVAPKSSPPARA